MRKNYFLLALGALSIASLSSCSEKNDFVGTWTATTPVDITRELPAAATASSLMSLTFEPSVNGQGDMMYTSIIDVTQGVDPTQGIVSPYEVSLTATASINGKWTYEGSDDDDLIVNFDPNSLKVDIDPTGVTFRENQLTDQQVPLTDSLTNATVELWKQQITSAVRRDLTRYTKLEDVKVTSSNAKGKMLRIEIENPEQTIMFRSVE